MLQLLAGLALVGLLGGCGGDDEDPAPGSTASSVGITTDVDFGEEPFSGTFEVTEGADALGCATGTFVDATGDEEIEKTFTCTDGLREGTFTALITRPSEEGEQTPWRVVDATADFAGLEGEGEFSVDEDDEDKTGVETLTGEVAY
jgi:hypothetical protein